MLKVMSAPAPAPDCKPFHVSAIPHTFLCPISCDIMEDPVTIAGDPTGQSYERQEIERWFGCCMGPKRAPTSNMVFDHPVLVANSALRNEIAQRLRPDDAPSAPPMPQDTCVPSFPNRTAVTPSAPPWEGSEYAYATPAAPAVPEQVGATANDFKNVVALGRSRIGHELQKSKTLASIVSASAGALGGLTGSAAVAVGVTCGLALAPCLVLVAGVGLLAAGTGLGVLIRRKKAGHAKGKPDIARKLTALREMRYAFKNIDKPTAAEKAVLKDVKTAIDLIDSPRTDWLKSLKWAAGAATIAIPIGVLLGLHIASQAQPNRDADDADAMPTEPARTPAPAQHAAGRAGGNTYIFNSIQTGSRLGSSDKFLEMASNLLLKHQFGKIDVASYLPGRRQAEGADQSVRVAMKTSWLAALDTHSYARLVDQTAAC